VPRCTGRRRIYRGKEKRRKKPIEEILVKERKNLRSSLEERGEEQARRGLLPLSHKGLRGETTKEDGQIHL